jgi:hypothetical protein
MPASHTHRVEVFGKLVRIQHGPATVSGDERCKDTLESVLSGK